MDKQVTEPQSVSRELRDQMFKRKLNQNGLARFMGVTASQLSEIVNGKRKMTMAFANKMHTRLGIAAETILKLKE